MVADMVVMVETVAPFSECELDNVLSVITISDGNSWCEGVSWNDGTSLETRGYN